MNPITPKQVRQLRKRWQTLETLKVASRRDTDCATRLKQLDMLYNFARQRGLLHKSWTVVPNWVKFKKRWLEEKK